MAGSIAQLAGLKVTHANGKEVSQFQVYYAFGLVTALFFLWGFSYGLLDVLNKHFQVVFNMTKLKSTLLQVAYFGAYIVFPPFAGLSIKRFGYKVGGVYLGLSLFCIGALMFWPSAHFSKYGGFVGASFVIASGLSTLEVTANSYVSVLGTPEQAAFRLNFAQSFNGLASFCGPLIASKYFFGSDEAQHSLTAVQFVYLAVACLGALIMALFFFAQMPEVTGSDLAEQQADAGFIDNRSFWVRKHMLLGFFTQLMYVGAQVSNASFVINYLTDDGSYSSADASRMFSYMQITFMVARFASTPLTRIFKPEHVLTGYGAGLVVFSLVAALTGGKAGLVSLFLVFVFESVCYPIIFVLGTSNMGIYTKQAASLLVMGVGGGAFFPSAQGAFADGANTKLSYIINAVGFSAVFFYGIGMTIYNRRFQRNLDNIEAARPASNSDAKSAGSQEKLETEFVN